MKKEFSTATQRANFVKEQLTKGAGKIPDTLPLEKSDKEDVISLADIRENMLLDMNSAVKQIDSLRAGSKDKRMIDITWGDFVKEKWGFANDNHGTCDSFYDAIGVRPAEHTIESLMTMPDFNDGFRWLVAEVIREAVRLGLRKNPIYPGLIAAEENVNQPSVVMPYINQSDAMPKRIGETETIPVGTMSFAQKLVTLQKVGTGIKMSDEVRQYVSLNVLSLYLQDTGVKLNIALDTMAINTLLNGDGNGNPSAVIGVDNTANGIVYKDLLRSWIRMGLLGRMPSGLMSNENMALDILLMNEFKGYGNNIGNLEGANLTKLNVRTPVPASQNYDVHGAMPADDQVMLIDTTSALIKLNSSALRVESDRIAERQINGTYISLTTGFANLFDDARILVDKTLDFATYGFPANMDVQALLSQSFK